jgi:hypothetical protein
MRFTNLLGENGTRHLVGGRSFGIRAGSRRNGFSSRARRADFGVAELRLDAPRRGPAAVSR